MNMYATVPTLSHLSGVSESSYKKVGPMLDGHVKEPYEMSMALGARP